MSAISLYDVSVFPDTENYSNIVIYGQNMELCINMTYEEFEQVVEKRERQNLELKESFGAETIETACAFANAGGGCIIIGIDDNRFTTVYKTRSEKTDQTDAKIVKTISQLQKKILIFLSQNPSASRRQIVEKISNETEGSIKYNLARLQKLGLLKHIGPDFGGKWEVFLD